MKIIYATILIVCCLPFHSYAGYPGPDPRCEPVATKSPVIFTDNTTNEKTTATFNVAGGVFGTMGLVTVQGYYTIRYASFFWENEQWNYYYASPYNVYDKDDPEDFDIANSGENWIDASAIPDCIPCEDEIAQAEAECGQNNWQWTDENNCQYECKCDAQEIYRGVTLCGGSAWAEVDYDTCIVGCVQPESDCSDELAAMQEGCKPYGIAWFSMETCEGDCNANCEGQWLELEEYCGIYQVKERRESDCWGECYPPPQDCDEFRANCEEGCSLFGGIDQYFCDPDMASTICICKEKPPEGETTAKGDDPDTNNPDADPAAAENTPAEDPADDPDDNANGWLKGIKENTDKQIEQNKEQIKKLNDITKNTKTTADNTKKIADNQGEIQKDLKSIHDTNKQGFENLVGAIDGLDDVDLDLGVLATTTAAPTLSGGEFDGTLPTDTDYTSLDDNVALATEQATADATADLLPDPETASPINAEVTASGDPCINGSVTMGGNSIPVSICFNRPWMLQGYAIMKIIMIALAYLQTAILLNKGIAA